MAKTTLTLELETEDLEILQRVASREFGGGGRTLEDLCTWLLREHADVWRDHWENITAKATAYSARHRSE